MQQIAIIGTGLMGSSLGLALKKRRVKAKVCAFARRAETREIALKSGVADTVADEPAAAVNGADLVVICVPILTIPALAEQILPALTPGAVVTDVGSTKSVLNARMDDLFADSGSFFVGSHPIAGSEKTGVESGDPDLYAGRLTVICPTNDTPSGAKEAVSKLWTDVGSEVIELSAEEHDALLASTSHLPHMIAAALARAVGTGAADGKAPFCGTGFKDTTRVASGSPGMWVDIIDTNRTALETELRQFNGELQGLIEILHTGSSGDIRRWLQEAARCRNSMLNQNRFLQS